MDKELSPRSLISPPRELRGRRSSGFTLVELLVVVAIIGLLVAMVVPAVGSARESARRLQCSNNIKQLAMGVLSFESRASKFPAGIYASKNSTDTTDRFWSAMILPYVEQQTVFNKLFVDEIDLETVMSALSGVSGSAPVSAYPAQYQEFVAATSQPLGIFQCPSAVNASQMTSLNGYARDSGIAVSNYVGSSGVNTNGDMRWSDNGGVFLYSHNRTAGTDTPRDVTIASIVDGTSSTFMLGERGTFKTTWDRANWLGVVSDIDGGDDAKRAVGTTWVPINPLAVPSELWKSNFSFSSEHPGGGNFAFCDGSVQFVSETIAFGWSGAVDATRCTNCAVFQLLSHRRDQQLLPSY